MVRIIVIKISIALWCTICCYPEQRIIFLVELVVFIDVKYETITLLLGIELDKSLRQVKLLTPFIVIKCTNGQGIKVIPREVYQTQFI